VSRVREQQIIGVILEKSYFLWEWRGVKIKWNAGDDLTYSFTYIEYFEVASANLNHQSLIENVSSMPILLSCYIDYSLKYTKLTSDAYFLYANYLFFFEYHRHPFGLLINLLNLQVILHLIIADCFRIWWIRRIRWAMTVIIWRIRGWRWWFIAWAVLVVWGVLIGV